MTDLDMKGLEVLSPCPFCGSAAEMERDDNSDYVAFHTWNVACSTCDSRGPEHQDKTEAITAWNRREAVACELKAQNATMREALERIKDEDVKPVRHWMSTAPWPGEAGPFSIIATEALFTLSEQET